MEKNAIVDNNVTIINSLLSCIVAFTLLSYSYTIALFAFIDPKVILYILIIICGLYISIHLKKLKKSIFELYRFKVSKWPWLVSLVSVLVFTILFLILSQKWGAWDAWAIWVRHAKSLTFHNDYIYLFKDDPIYSHSDYPLMLPSFIASVWSSFNSITSIVPLFTAYFTSLSIVLLSSASLIGRSRIKYWLISLLFLSISPIIYKFGSSQYADTLLALFFLIPFIIVNNKSKFNKHSLLFLGFIVASSAWVKNEGIVFFLVFSVLFILKRRKLDIWYILGSMIPLLILIYFKIKIAPTNDLIAEQELGFFHKLSDTNRYTTIVIYALKSMINKYLPFTLFIITLIILNLKHLKNFGSKVILLMLISYFMVYVLTPKGLDWHLATSLTRLIHHITPALFYLLMLSTIQNKALNIQIDKFITIFKLDPLLK